MAMILVVVPVTTATVKSSFDMKLVKTRLKNRLGDTSLDQAMIVSIDGPETLDNVNLDCIGRTKKSAL